MAEGTTSCVKKLVCWHFLNTSCYYGNWCKFKHDKTESNSENIVCRFSLKGTCMFGDNCNFSHQKPPGDVNMRGLDSYSSWINAPEFVPAIDYSTKVLQSNDSVDESVQEKLDMEFCPHFTDGVCPYDTCPCIHGEMCRLCGKYCLNPFDQNQRSSHMKACESERSIDTQQMCGICLDVVLEKAHVADRRFGILENCNHVFCLSCIKKWRNVRNSADSDESSIDISVSRACPECRVPSNFYVPSHKWVDSEDEKEQLVADYRIGLSKKHCKYFKRGRGNCPFGEMCFHLHERRAFPVRSTRRRRFD